LPLTTSLLYLIFINWLGNLGIKMNGKSKGGWEMVGDGQCQTEERCILQLETFYMVYTYTLLSLKKYHPTSPHLNFISSSATVGDPTPQGWYRGPAEC
jgi:hypothetical protein